MKSNIILFHALLILAATPASADLISVNFEQFTPSLGTFAVENTLEGPAGGLNTEWNQYADEDSTGVMVDSTGAATTVTFTTTFTEGRTGSTANLPVFRSTLTDFAKGTQNRNLTITGLTPNGFHDVWILAYRDNSSSAERLAADWSTSNPTTSPSLQTIDSRTVRNGTTFQAGVNYVLFEDVLANGSGTIVFDADAKLGTDSGSSSDDWRSGLSGFQIREVAPPLPPEPLEFTNIVRNPATGEVTLTWKSNPGTKYGLYWSDDLVDFVMHGTHHAIPAHASGNRTTLGPFSNPLPGSQKLFFLVGPPDLSNPVMSQVHGSGTTVTLVFSERIDPQSVAALGNFSVTLGGVPVSVLAASLDASGKKITLTLGNSLQAGTGYDVNAQNITTLAGRVIPSAFNGSFQTWDNDPNGVQVFILAGQSNMVGHGKTEIGRNPGDPNDTNFPGGYGCLRRKVNEDPTNFGHLVNGDGTWKIRSDVKVWWRDSDLEDPRAVIKGDLKIGYSQSRNPEWIGPEFAFGWAVGDYFTDKPVLIIKTAWGGKSLHVDFRPPSAVAARGGVVGSYYTGMIDYARDCLTNLGTEFPALAGMRYRIAGFGWHQGYNDRIDATASAAYEANLVDLINDLRAEFSNPALPVSITTTSMDPPPAYTVVELAQLAMNDPVKYPGFVGNVKTTDARPFWRLSSVSPSNFGYHWNHNGESQFLNGKAMGDEMVIMLTP